MKKNHPVDSLNYARPQEARREYQALLHLLLTWAGAICFFLSYAMAMALAALAKAKIVVGLCLLFAILAPTLGLAIGLVALQRSRTLRVLIGAGVLVNAIIVCLLIAILVKFTLLN